MRLRSPLTALGATLVFGLLATAADAACTRLAFSVNDYGKEGPTKDAKNLLDTYIAKWTAERGIAKYTTGKKDVTCELFLDFGVFDEHTCKASASVCWEGNAVPIDAAAPATGVKTKAATAPAGAVPKAATAKAAAKSSPSLMTTGGINKVVPKVAPAAPAAVAPAAAAAAPVVVPAAPAAAVIAPTVGAPAAVVAPAIEAPAAAVVAPKTE